MLLSPAAEEEAVTLFDYVLFGIIEDRARLSALKVMKTLSETKLSPTIETFNLFIRACTYEPDGLQLAQVGSREPKIEVYIYIYDK